jgi:hypothetical protein
MLATSAQSAAAVAEEAILSDLLGAASRSTSQSRERTYGLDYWKNQFLKSELEVIWMLYLRLCLLI